MKKNKKALFVILPLVAISLSSCSTIIKAATSLISSILGGGNNVVTISGLEIKGSQEEAEIIANAASKTIASISANTGIIPGELSEAKEDDGDYIYLTTKQFGKSETTGNKGDVIIEWGYDTTSASFESYTPDNDGSHARIDFKFPGYGNPEAQFNFYVKKLTYNKATCETPINYSVKLVPAVHKHDYVTIADIYALNETQDGFNIVDYEDTNYYKPNYGQDYYYVSVPGKVVYISPDGNWGLIGDGDKILEIYAGSALDLDTNHYPCLTVGNYVVVTGNMGIYNGNMQIGFITKIKALEDHTGITDPTSHKTLTQQMLSANQYDEGMMNGLFQVSGTVKSKPGTLTSSGRDTFEINVGTSSLIIAYDYHTGKGADNVLKSFNDALNGKSVGSNITIKGTLRYNGTGFSNDGHWELVPFTVGDIA